MWVCGCPMLCTTQHGEFGCGLEWPFVKQGRKNGAAGEIRTPDLVLRRHALYPSELQPRRFIYIMGKDGAHGSARKKWEGVAAIPCGWR